MLVRDTQGQFEVIDFRESAPSGASQNMFVKDPEKSKIGGLSVAVPGEVAGLFYVYRKYRKFRQNGPTWKQLIEPSIKLARNGFQISRKMYDGIKAVKDQLKKYEELSKLYLDKEGNPLSAGTTVKRPNLANTLEIIADESDAETDTDEPIRGAPKSFYQGKMAESMVEAVRGHEGILQLKDLQQYTVISRKPITSMYRNHRVVTAGPPACGSVLLYMLNIIERFKFQSMFNPVEAHRVIETMKFGYGARMSLGDADFVGGMDRIVSSMISKEKANVAVIDDSKTFDNASHYTANFAAMNNHGTTHVSAMGSNGMIVSVTSTINLLFGSMVQDPETGILLNDHMDDFSTPGMDNFFGLAPSPNNYIEPGKRPISSAAPVCVEKDGQPVLVSGAAGGSLITSATMLSLVNIMEFALTPEAALAAPRVHHQLHPNTVIVENTFSKRLEEELAKYGHAFKRVRGAQYRSSVQLIVIDENGLLHPVSDPRKEGAAGGF